MNLTIHYQKNLEKKVKVYSNLLMTSDQQNTILQIEIEIDIDIDKYHKIIEFCVLKQ